MKSWILGITIICALVVAAWSISSVMGNVYGSNIYSANTGDVYSADEDCCGETEEAGGSTDSASTGEESGCCGSGDSDESPEEQASAYYIEKTGDTDFEVVIEDQGCHSEAKIIKDGQVVMELSINGGQVTEI